MQEQITDLFQDEARLRNPQCTAVDNRSQKRKTYMEEWLSTVIHCGTLHFLDKQNLLSISAP